MPPAFDSTRQAAAFGLLILFLLAAPWLGGKFLLPPREQAYATEGWSWGPYPWDQKQIFGETNDIDIAFVGASHMFWGIDTPQVQQDLDRLLRRPTVVRSICWGGSGPDALYFITKDLLEHRHVKTLVFYIDVAPPTANYKAPHWFRFGDDAAALTGLPTGDKAVYYFAAIIGMPRNLLELWTPNLPEAEHPAPNFDETTFHAENPETRLGSLDARMSIDPVRGPYQKFTPYTPRTDATPADVCLQTSPDGPRFKFQNQPLPAWQIHFIQKFGELAKEHGAQLVLLHLPTMAEGKSPFISEPEYWPKLLSGKVVMMGIPPARLFSGLSTEEMDKLFGDPVHLNLNGQKYFTQLITPALLQLYESHPSD